MEYLQYNSNAELNFNATPKRKRNYACDGLDGNPVRQRSQANARERDRTHRCKMTLSSVNSAFTTLRTLIPTEPKDRKLSKIETLRLASSYISHLGTQLMAGRIDQPCLRIPKQMLENNETPNATNRHQVCTFCIAHKKAPKNQNFDDYVCSLENQTYYDQNLIDASTNISNASTDLYF